MDADLLQHPARRGPAARRRGSPSRRRTARARAVERIESTRKIAPAFRMPSRSVYIASLGSSGDTVAPPLIRQWMMWARRTTWTRIRTIGPALRDMREGLTGPRGVASGETNEGRKRPRPSVAVRTPSSPTDRSRDGVPHVTVAPHGNDLHLREPRRARHARRPRDRARDRQHRVHLDPDRRSCRRSSARRRGGSGSLVALGTRILLLSSLTLGDGLTAHAVHACGTTRSRDATSSSSWAASS